MTRHLKARVACAISMSLALFFSVGMLPGATSLAASQPACQAAGTTGLTAAVVATAGQKISGAVDATGCDIGIYVGPTATNVTIDGATVSGANDHGVMVEDASGTVIEHSVISGNALKTNLCPQPPAKPTGPCIADDKAIQLAGTSYAEVVNNVVTGNMSGGIAVVDDGPIDPGAPDPGALHAAYHNLISGNVVAGNKGGCGIVVAAFNPGAGASNNVVRGNIVTQNPGGIIVAADTPHTLAINNDVFDNVASNNFLPGVIVHSNAPADIVRGTNIQGNVLNANGGDPSAFRGKGPKSPTGIIIAAEPLPPGVPAGTPAAMTGSTTVSNNSFQGEVDSVLWGHP